MHGIVRSGRGSKDCHSFGNAGVPRAQVGAMITWSQKRVADFILVSQWFVRAVVCYGRRRSQDTTASGPAHVDVLGVAVIAQSVAVVVAGVVVAADTGSARMAVVK